MLVCATCGSRWDEEARPAVTFSPRSARCAKGRSSISTAWRSYDAEPVHADVASVLREHLLGVGA